jgi:hypothetical protein
VNGHVNGKNYSFAPGGWDTNQSFSDYVSRNQEFRSGTGVSLNLSPQEEREFEQCLQSWNDTYDLANANCGTPFKDCLNWIGRGIGSPFFPADIGNQLLQSPIYGGTTSYPGPQRPWWRDNWFSQ